MQVRSERLLQRSYHSMTPQSWSKLKGYLDYVSWLWHVYSCSQYASTSLIIYPEHCDLKALQRRGVRLGYTPDVLTDAGAYTLFDRTVHELMCSIEHSGRRGSHASTHGLS